MPKLQMKMVSSLEKCFYNDTLDSKPEKRNFVMFRNERLSFQVMYRTEDPDLNIKRWCNVKLGGSLGKYATVRLVTNVPNMYPTYNVDPGGEFISREPGMYPDLIRPLIYPNSISLPHNQTHSMWVDIELPENFEAGEYDITVSVSFYELLGEVSGTVRVIDAELPPQTLIHTEWFYTDCIANYYNVKAFSAKHWKYIENFLRTATKNGINMILTPVFTPALDTYIGGERMTTQLVDIELASEGNYSFGFNKLHRWIDLCLECGVEYFEIPHLFTQWGAKATPKIIVKVNGRNKKYFGWHTDSMGEEYEGFLSKFIPALISEFKKRGLDNKLFFHISDEPNLDTLEQYMRCKKKLDKLLNGYPVIDALSNFEFFEKGILDKPIPKTITAKPFIDAGAKDLWVYYCGGGRGGASDRSISMPSQRTRILGVQLYYYNIQGFLHWGYNFYNSCHSYTPLDPYGYPDGEYFTPSGDCFLVYPGHNGEAWESLRLNAMREAMDDIRALRLYEKAFGKEATKELIMRDINGEFDFTHYPTAPDYLINLRERIADALDDEK